jgi:hypothetical protein
MKKREKKIQIVEVNDVIVELRYKCKLVGTGTASIRKIYFGGPQGVK